MLSRLTQWWSACPTWLRWIVGVLLGFLPFLLLRRKPQAPSLTERDRQHLRDAVRPIEKRGEQHRRAGEQHAAEAERQLEEADTKRTRLKDVSRDEVRRRSEEYARRIRKGPMLALVGVLLASSSARADEPLPFDLVHPETGAAGWWIPDDVWRDALGKAEAFEALTAAVAEFREARLAFDLERETLLDVVAFERGQADSLSMQLAASKEREAKAHRWYRSPRFLVPLGVVLGGVAGTWLGVRATR
jgi:hypothetical protein